MHVAIWILLTLTAVNVVSATINHGRVKKATRHNAVAEVLNASIFIGLLAWAGVL